MMNQTRKNLLSYSNSAIHSLSLIKEANLDKSERLELVYTLAPKINPFLLNHKISIYLPKGWLHESVVDNPTRKAFNDYLIVLARILQNVQHNHIKLSLKTEFAVEVSDTLDNFNLHHDIDPELKKISQMSTAELTKRVKEAGGY